MTQLWINKADNERAAILFAHGAGAPMDSPFMVEMANRLSRHDITCMRFEFAYMAARRSTGKKPGPAKVEKLMAEYAEVISEVQRKPLFIAGKSLGGRVASMIADEQFAADNIAGLICLGYPFHPPGKPDKLRTDHLLNLRTPGLIVQGARDPFGNQTEVPNYDLSPKLTVEWIEAANHDLTAPKSSGLSRDECWDQAAAKISAFITVQLTGQGKKICAR